MPKYLKTKAGSLESAVLEAVSPAQQAAIAISKKEKGEKPKNEEKTECPQCEGKGCDHCEGKGYHTAEELSAKQKKIDLNKNGKVDGDDLAKLRAKKDKNEEVELDELREPYAVVDTADGDKVVGTASDEKGAKSIITTSELPPMKIKDKKTLKIVKVKKKQMIGQPLKEETSLIELAAKHISDMWKEASGTKTEEEEPKKSKKENKTTMTGKPMSKVEVAPSDKED